MGIDGPHNGFSCWAWDYDNDGWLDIFATCYEMSLDGVVKGLMGQPHDRKSESSFFITERPEVSRTRPTMPV